MKDNLHVESAGIQAVSSQLSAIGNRIHENYCDLKTIIDDLNGSWLGQGKDSTLPLVNNISSQADKNNAMMNNFAQFLDGVVVPGFNEVETSNIGLAEMYK